MLQFAHENDARTGTQGERGGGGLDTRGAGARSVRGANMSDKQLLERIALDPQVMVGKPVIRGTRLTVEYILNLLAHGVTTPEILDEYEGLTPEDIQACLLFATRSLENTSFMPLAGESA
jgi:uncharacterized protein (DUF433 family)